ncbi:hypothetical protein BJX70DRAFT_365129 [Aspergillus crustosus]
MHAGEKRRVRDVGELFRIHYVIRDPCLTPVRDGNEEIAIPRLAQVDYLLPVFRVFPVDVSLPISFLLSFSFFVSFSLPRA